MSTWAALFQPDGDVESILFRMREALRQQPADGQWQWSDGQLGMVCRPLLIHEPHGHPGMPVRDGRVAIVFDGRLDNRAALVSALEIPPSTSDPALVLACYRRFGESCVGQLEGDFAFALADGARELLLLARDVVGVRPLYYTATPNGFYCASRVSPLLGAPTPLVPDLAALARLVCRPRALGATETFLAGVHALPPAHALVANRYGHRLWKYWEADASPYRGLTPDQCAEAFRVLLVKSVQHRLRGVARAAVQVSGGLDSSAILCLARNSGACVTGVYHGGSSGGADDETAYLDVLEAAGHTIERVPLLSSGYPERMPEAVAQSELPLVDEFPALTQRVAERAREQGTRLLLNGTWADQLLFPFPPGYLIDLFRRLRWVTCARHLLAYPAWLSDVPRTLIWSTALRALIRAHVPETLLRRARRRPLDASLRLVHPDLRGNAIAEVASLERWSSCASEHSRAIERNLRSRIATMSMEGCAKIFAAQGIDISFPYLERDLITLLVSAPPLAQMPDGRPKGLLRRSLTQLVPRAVLQRRDKGDYSEVVEGVTRTSIEQVFSELRDGHAIRAGFLDETLFLGSLAQLRTCLNIADVDLAAALARLYAVECWLRRFGAHRGTRPGKDST